MRNAYTYWAAGIATVTLGITVGYRLLEKTAQPFQQLASSAIVAPEINRKATATADNKVASQSIQTVDEQRDAQNIVRLDVSRADSSVVGRPFALSASMQAELKKSDVFRAAQEVLEQMAREPRDDKWASLKESQIQDLTLSYGIYVRNVECRTTICAVEAATVNEPFDVITIEQQLTRLDLLGPEYLTFAHETDDNGNSIKVALFAIRRR
jgi:hypothetical protein